MSSSDSLNFLDRRVQEILQSLEVETIDEANKKLDEIEARKNVRI